MIKKRFSFIRFVEKTYDLVQRLPKYQTKFSKKTFTIGQIIVLRTLKEVLNCSYERLIGFLDDFPIIGEIIHLKRTPHPTTILKYSRRIGIERINQMIGKSSKAKKTYNRY